MIEVPGEVRFTRQMAYADLGSTTVLYCDHVGAPQPNITWFSNKNEILNNVNNTQKYKIYPNGTIEIRKIELEDDGLYKCTVFNEFTSDAMKKRQGNIYLNVQCKQQMVLYSRFKFHARIIKRSMHWK